MLFSMGKYSTFPVDVWVKRAVMHFYNAEEASLIKIIIFARDKFGNLSKSLITELLNWVLENVEC